MTGEKAVVMALRKLPADYVLEESVQTILV
jgi:hypothetical protein